MDSKEIGQLLEKYWNCETSLEEEKALRAYFKDAQVPDNMKDAANLFRFFESERQRSLNENFDHEVMRSVKKTESSAKVISLVSRQVSGVRWVQVARIAAGVLVVVVAGYFVKNEVMKSKQQQAALEDTFTDPKQALEETKKALMLISKGFGKAKQGASQINRFNEAEDKISGKNKDNKSEEDSTNI